MFLYQSNQTQKLFHRLCTILEKPLADPLQPEIIIVQNQGMARWLRQQIALATGIAANLDFPLPARFIWDIFSSQMGELPCQSTFERDILQWRILSLLPRLCRETEYGLLRRYLDQDPDGRKHFQLAGRISDLFDQYLVFRPDLLAAWEQGRESHWQAVLWRMLCKDDGEHRGRLLFRFLDRSRGSGLECDRLPERISLFGLNTLAPAYLEVLHRISTCTEVHLFHLNPCRHFWGDLVSRQELAKLHRKWRLQGTTDMSGYYEAGHPLLASQGTVGRDFFRQLVELDLQDEELYASSGRTSILGHLQDDILDLINRSGAGRDDLQLPLAPDDHSIQFHICHGAMREVQVLHDRLLDLFARYPDLRPADILVMAPDIGQYAPAVAGVFGAAGEERFIPWSVADQERRHEQPAGNSFLELLALLDGRCTAPEVMAFLENESVLHRFDLDETALPLLRTWIREAGIRWGLDREHRHQLGMDAGEQHSWLFGMNRLLLGYVMGTGSGLFDDIMPWATESAADSVILGSLADFFNHLVHWQRTVRQKMAPDRWSDTLLRLLETFFAPAGNDTSLADLREAVAGLDDQCRRAGFDLPLSLQVIRTYFGQVLEQPAGGQAYLTGRVTFCNMVPMRSVPFRVICLLGMNNTDYPRSQRPPDFDLMAQKPRIGDRNRRNDDRYLFLEALLSARDVFYISWKGRDQHENALLPPSVVVGELQDYLDRAFFRADGVAPTEQLTADHPLQPFSRRCFDPGSTSASYASEWLPATGPQPDAVFLASPLPDPADDWRQVELASLVRFWTHPVRFFLQQRLGLRLQLTDNQLPESEPFALDNLELYRLAEETLAGLLTAEEEKSGYRELQAAGRLPHGAFGSNRYHEISDRAHGLARRVRPLLDRPIEPVEIALQTGDFQLSGWLHNLSGSGLVTWRSTTCKAGDMLRLWILHLVLNLATPTGIPRVSTHVAEDSIIRFNPLSGPENELLPFLELYRQGLREPIHFYPRTSMAWARAREDRRMKEAKKAWYSSSFHCGEEEDIHYRIALRGSDPLDQRFEQLGTVLGPLLDHLEEIDAVS